MGKFLLKKIYTKDLEYKNRVVENKTNNINPAIGKSINRIDEKTYELLLCFEINKSNNENVPFEIKLTLSGEFSFENMEEHEIIHFLNNNGIQIVFPYLRSSVSSVMSSLMLQPILLPIIDIRSVFKK